MWNTVVSSRFTVAAIPAAESAHGLTAGRQCWFAAAKNDRNYSAPPVSLPANDRSPQGPDAPAAALLFDAVL